MATKKKIRRVPKQREKNLQEEFNCPNCKGVKTLEVKFLKEHIGVLLCRMCKVTWSTRTNSLSQPIDVYSEWVDDCIKRKNGFFN